MSFQEDLVDIEFSDDGIVFVEETYQTKLTIFIKSSEKFSLNPRKHKKKYIF